MGRPQRGGKSFRGRGKPGGGRKPLSGAVSKDDFRWKKAKKGKKQQYESGDAIDEYGDGQTAQQQSAQFASSTQASQNGGSQPLSSSKRNREKLAEVRAREKAARKRRKENLATERKETDAAIRDTPHTFLSERYAQWASERPSDAKAVAAEFSEGSVVSVVDNGESSLLDDVRRVVGADYRSKTGWTKKSFKTDGGAGVACIALGNGALRAAKLAPRLYDGRPVGKLFSKHIKVEEQREWLKRCCAKGLAPSAVGTAKRVSRLIEEERLTLKHTPALIVDFTRDERLRNMTDMPAVVNELFEFIHAHALPLIMSGDMKVFLLIQTEEKMAQLESEFKPPVPGGSKKRKQEKQEPLPTEEPES